jgi:DNA polymerase-1
MKLNSFLQQHQLIFCHLVMPQSSLLSPPKAILLYGLDEENTFIIDETQEADLDLLRLTLAAPDRVFVFADAKPALRHLLSWGLWTARPLCLATLNNLLEQKPEYPYFSENVSEAQTLKPRLIEEFHRLQETLQRSPYQQIARLECLVISAFAHMEHRGLYIDQKAWRTIIDDEEEKKNLAQEDFFKAAQPHVKIDLFGRPDINLEQDEALRQLFEKLTQQPLERLHKNTLKSLDHPAAKALLKYREAAKLVSTYGESFLSHIHSQTRRIHATFEPLGTSTGRVSCHGPNLQNLPTDARFHEAICAPDDKVLVTADYATCELRVLAALSGDKTFIEAFAQDADLHSRVASEMFHQPVSKTENPHLRQRAKAINFGLIYGMGHRALGRQVGVSEEEARVLLKQYFDASPGIAAFLEESVAKARQNGYAQTVLRRRLYFEANDSQISRVAKNMPIQGTSAEIAKLAMIRLNERLWHHYPNAFLVNMIHDEIVVECPKEDGEAISTILVEEMERAQRTLLPNVKPKADVNLGKTWIH